MLCFVWGECLRGVDFHSACFTSRGDESLTSSIQAFFNIFFMFNPCFVMYGMEDRQPSLPCSVSHQPPLVVWKLLLRQRCTEGFDLLLLFNKATDVRILFLKAFSHTRVLQFPNQCYSSVPEYVFLQRNTLRQECLQRAHRHGIFSVDSETMLPWLKLVFLCVEAYASQ